MHSEHPSEEEKSGLVKKIQEHSLSILLGKSRVVNIIAIQSSESESDDILNIDDAELFFKNKFGKKIVYTNSYIPYHFLVTKNGTIFETAPLSSPALSFIGHVNDGISICYVGGVKKDGISTKTMTTEQLKSINWLVSELKRNLGVASVVNDN